MPDSYANRIVATKLMLAGLKANSETLTKRGIDEKFITQLDTVYQETLTLNNEQQALKARLKEKTAALNEKVAAMQKLRGEARKLVKIDFPKESWKEFGIQVTR